MLKAIQKALLKKKYVGEFTERSNRTLIDERFHKKSKRVTSIDASLLL